MNIEALSYMMLGGAALLLAQTAWRIITTPRPVEQQPDPLSPAQIMATDLSEGVVRERLTKFLAGLGITGDANIRNGYVVETVPPRDLGDVNTGLRVRVSTLLGHAARGRMQGRDLYYAWRAMNPLPGAPEIEYRLADIELDDVAKLIVLGERVNEDRKRSRSLYRGLEDSEIDSLANVAVRKVKGRDEDATPFQLAIARAAIETLFSIKGASA